MLRIVDMSFSFIDDKRSLPVLDCVNLNFEPGQICALVGPSGCGKTTLLNLIAGLLTPGAGKIEFGRLPRRVGYVFQAATLVPWRTIWSNALLGAEIARRDPSACAEQAMRLLEAYGLAEFIHAYPSALSGGMQQRVSIVRAILSGARVLLLDEPFSNSDYNLRRSLQRDVSRAVDEEGLVAVLVTHDIEEAVMIGDRVVVLTRRPARVKNEISIPLPRSLRLDKRLDLVSELMPYTREVYSALAEDQS